MAPFVACALVATGVSLVSATRVEAASQNATLVGAVKQGDPAAVRTLLKRGVNVNAQEPDGTTALHWAVNRNDLDLLKVLLTGGARPNLANRYGITPLWLASVDGNAAAVEVLLTAGADANTTRADSGETVLMIAARSGNVDTVKLLLARGARVNAVEPLRRQTALMWAAAEKHPAVVRMLVEAGADKTALSKTGISPLMFAIRANDLESVRTLLDAGLDVNAPAADGTSMLMLAILNAHFDLGAFLLERGANPNVDDPHGRPLHVLAFLRRADNRSLSVVIPRQMPAEGLDSIGMARALLQHGADINARFVLKVGAELPGGQRGMGFAPKHMAVGSYRIPFTGATPFFIAATMVDVPFMKFLAANGANPKEKTEMGITPLLSAAGVGFWEGEHPGTQAEALEAVKLCVELGDDPKAQVDYGTQRGDPTWNNATAMHGAANRGADDLVRWLAEKGVPLDGKSQRGISPWHIAAGLDGGLFHAWPGTANLIVQLAEKQGVTIDRSEPKAPASGAYARPSAAQAVERAK